MLKCKKLTYAFDLDSTLCTLSKSGKYNDVEPLVERIAKVNELHDHGHRIVIYTARGMGKCNGDASWAYDEWFIFTRNQLYLWNVKHDRLIMGKASYDVIVDDKAVRDVDFFKTRVTVPKFTTSGIITGVFDVIHPGYTQMIRTAKSECDNIFALIHIDPSLENPRKSKPILTVSERVDTMRELLRSSDVVTCYKTEAELFKLLILLQDREVVANGEIKMIQYLGDDYRDRDYTGKELNIPVAFMDRSHGWSATKFKNLVSESVLNSENVQPIVKIHE